MTFDPSFDWNAGCSLAIPTAVAVATREKRDKFAVAEHNRPFIAAIASH
jgi:hypothetical protein